MKAVAFFVLIFSAAVAHGGLDRSAYLRGDWESLREQTLFEPASASESGRRLAQLAELKAAKELCEIQIESTRLPVECFRLLSLETKLQLVGRRRAVLARHHIDEICSRRSRTQFNFGDFSKEKIPKDTNCFRSAVKRLERLKYGSAFRQPGVVFDSRYQR